MRRHGGSSILGHLDGCDRDRVLRTRLRSHHRLFRSSPSRFSKIKRGQTRPRRPRLVVVRRRSTCRSSPLPLPTAAVSGACSEDNSGCLVAVTDARSASRTTWCRRTWSNRLFAVPDRRQVLHGKHLLGQRLGLERAELSTSQLAAPTSTCNCHKANGTRCGAPLDTSGFHALTDQSGGGVLERHGRVAKAVGGLVKHWRQVTPLYEQRVPDWDRPRRNPAANEDPIERAILDVEYATEGGRCWIDVTVRHPAAGDESAVRSAGRRDGEASRRAERAKHERYPGPQLVPFALETPGRMGAEATAWLLAKARRLPTDMQSAEMTRAYKVLSCALQTEVVRQLRRAAGIK